MKRSEINAAIRNALQFFREWKFAMPPFAEYTPEKWRSLSVEQTDEIFKTQLGWDVTSFGSNDFAKVGLMLFTLRNGHFSDPSFPKPYAEKILMVLENQITPRHFHWKKREDIINRGGGNLVIELFHADPVKRELTGKDFVVKVNAEPRHLASGDKVILTRGESICLESIHAHRFYGQPGLGPVLVGEVSSVNDDRVDNFFVDGTPRFDEIIEDEPAAYWLASDYPDAK